MHFYPWDARHGFSYRSIAEDKRHLHVRDDYFKYLRSAGYRKYHGNEHDGYHENIGAIKSIVPYEYSWDHFVGKEACRFIDNYGKDGPFAMMVGFPGPHDPYDPSEDFGDIPSEDSVPEPIPIYEHDEPHVEAQKGGGRAEWADLNFSDMNTQDSKKKRKMRAHYAGLVQQIDYEVGEIIKSLEKNNLIDNTVIFFATDHGDHLGDHGLFGKGTFHEASAHIPLIVRTPETVNKPKRSNQLVYLYDITATILTLAGAEIPSYYDSKPLPDIPGIKSSNREILFGLQPHGWMAYDGTWKLAKYRNGVRTLFNMDDDKNEAKNLYDNPENFVLRSELEAKLSTEIMDSINFSVFDRMIDTKNSLNESNDFGMEGWEWKYPASPMRKFGITSASDPSEVILKNKIKDNHE
jgi:arylsulfatase A-like enzyme